jgi:crossover junction endodeoxyribonuclease RusA
VKLTLPLPPSVNRFWRTYRGRMLVSREGRAWKQLADVAVAAQCRQRVLGGDVQVSIVAYFPDKRRDLDNAIKPALDCMQGSAYANDRQIVRIIAEKRYDKQNPRLEIELIAA